MSVDVYTEVTNTIIAELEKGAAPWVQPWHSKGIRTPHNAITKRPYSGINALLLWIEAMNKGYEHGAWLTYKQAKEAGGHVRKGEKSTLVVLVKPFEVAVEKDGEETTETRLLMRGYRVFNVSQCDGLPDRLTTVEKRETVADPEFDSWVRRTGAKLKTGDKACYTPALDAITMPPRSDFKSSAHYSATILHELGHWTGHESRLNRDLNNRFGDQGYAAEELIAELTSAFLCADMGINGDLRHAGYVESWLKLLRNNKRAIFTAASQAQKAADFLKEAASAAEKEKRIAA
jgi:antirestriction protein ArdC